MDTNTFALFVLGFGTIIVAIVVWQIFAIARARMPLNRAQELDEATKRCQTERQRLGSRLGALADDVQAIERRLSRLE